MGNYRRKIEILMADSYLEQEIDVTNMFARNLGGKSIVHYCRVSAAYYVYVVGWILPVLLGRLALVAMRASSAFLSFARYCLLCAYAV